MDNARKDLARRPLSRSQTVGIGLIAAAWLAVTVMSFVVGPKVLLSAYDGESIGWLNEKIAAHRDLASTRGLPARDRDWYADSAYRYAWRGVAYATVAAAIALLAVFHRTTLSKLKEFLFHADSAINLGIARTLVFSVVLLSLYQQPIGEVATMPKELYQWPAIAPWLLGWLPIEPSFVALVLPAAMIACLGAALGLAFRVTGPVAAVLSILLLGIPTLTGKVDHNHHLVLLAAILACSPADHAFSVSSLLNSSTAPQRSVAYGLPLRLCWVVIATCYFFPGFWKAAAGPDWVFGEALRNTALNVWFVREDFEPLLRVDQLGLLSAFGALGTIAFEVGFLPALPFRRCRWAMIVAGQLFHTMVLLTLGIWFWSLQLIYVLFVDWDRLWQSSRAAPIDRRENNEPESIDAGSAARKPFALWMIFALTWFGMLATGFTRTVAAWPVACYPTFDGTPDRKMNWPRFFAVWEDGRRAELDDDAIRDRFGAARYVQVLRPLVVESNDESDVLGRLAGLLPAWEESGELSASDPPATIEVETAKFDLVGPGRPDEPVEAVSRGVFTWDSLQAETASSVDE